jgi:hypothetical protein
MKDYRWQLKKGTIQTAYRGLMDYMMGLRTHFEKKYPVLSIGSNLRWVYGYELFSFFPKSLKAIGLKIGIVFIHETFRFEVWLFGCNKRSNQTTGNFSET